MDCNLNDKYLHAPILLQKCSQTIVGLFKKIMKYTSSIQKQFFH